VWLNCSIGIVLNLLVFAGPIAIGTIFSAGSIAQYTAFLIPLSLRAIFRRSDFRPGPWNMGVFSLPCTVLAIAWVLLVIPVLSFPANNGANLNAASMNWTCVLYGGVMSSALVWYGISARHWFKGPKVLLLSTFADRQTTIHTLNEEEKAQ
jgi:amino acid transporter